MASCKTFSARTEVWPSLPMFGSRNWERRRNKFERSDNQYASLYYPLKYLYSLQFRFSSKKQGFLS